MSDSQFYFEVAVWSQVVSSMVFIAVLVYIWKRFVMPVLLAAQERSNRVIAEAERHRDEVKGALTALHEAIESARRDAELIESRAGDHAEHERLTVLREAGEAGERAVAEAGRELDRARAAARQQLRDEILQRALALARDEASQRIGPGVDARFVDRFTLALERQSHD